MANLKYLTYFVVRRFYYNILKFIARYEYNVDNDWSTLLTTAKCSVIWHSDAIKHDIMFKYYLCKFIYIKVGLL